MIAERDSVSTPGFSLHYLFRLLPFHTWWPKWHVLSRKIESFYERRVSSLVLRQEGGVGEGSSVRATRKRAHLAQTVEITRMFSILARGGLFPARSPIHREEIPIPNFLFTLCCMFQRTRPDWGIRDTWIWDLSSPTTKNLRWVDFDYFVASFDLSSLSSSSSFLLLPFISLMKRREKGIKYSLVVFPHAHRCSRMKITITSLCSRIVRITRQLWRRRNRWAQLWSKYTPRTGTIRTTEVFHYLLFIYLSYIKEYNRIYLHVNHMYIYIYMFFFRRYHHLQFRDRAWREVEIRDQQ